MRAVQRHTKGTDRYVRVEPAAASVERSVHQVRSLVRAGKVPAIRRGNLLLIDIRALKAHYAPRPVDAGRVNA